MAAAGWATEAKRGVIIKAENRMTHFEQLMTERPRLAGLWRYWFHWYRVRRADWQTRLWLEQVRAWKKQLRQWEASDTINQHLPEAERIGKNVGVVEDGMKLIAIEMRDTLRLAREREWHIRYPRPQTTMAGWIISIHDRYKIIHEWIRRIREELPRPWINFCYVIYYAYTSPGAERHLEAHLEGKCIGTDKVKQIVKEYANRILRAWVAAPMLVAGKERPGYAMPLLQNEMSKPPFEGRKISGQNMWQWGVQWNASINYMVADNRLVKGEPSEIMVKKTVTLRAELFDYDYSALRKFAEVEVPALWWELPLEQLLKLFNVGEER